MTLAGTRRSTERIHGSVIYSRQDLEALILGQAEMGDRYRVSGGERSMHRSTQARKNTGRSDRAWLMCKIQGGI